MRWDAELYESNHSIIWKRGTDLAKLLDPKPGERILDVGCGTGHLTAQIAAWGTMVVGVDSSEEMIAEARRQFPELIFLTGDARNLRFAEPFDAIFSNAALHWIKGADLAAGSMLKCLRPAGRLVVELGGKGNIHHLMNAFRKARAALGFSENEEVDPWFFPSVAEYTSILESVGFEVSLALLFDRPTPLEDGERGLRNWIRMFGRSFYSDLPVGQHNQFFMEVENFATPSLFRDGQWVLDYRRLRVMAHRL